MFTANKSLTLHDRSTLRAPVVSDKIMIVQDTGKLSSDKFQRQVQTR